MLEAPGCVGLPKALMRRTFSGLSKHTPALIPLPQLSASEIQQFLLYLIRPSPRVRKKSPSSFIRLFLFFFILTLIFYQLQTKSVSSIMIITTMMKITNFHRFLFTSPHPENSFTSFISHLLL